MSFTFSKKDELRSAGRFSTFKHLVQLLQDSSLIAGKLRRRDHAHVHVEVALAPAMRIWQAFGLQTNDGTRLGSFGNGNFLFTVETGDADLGAKRGLRNTDRYGAVKIRATALKERMLLYFQNNIEVAGGAPLAPGSPSLGTRMRVCESTPGGMRTSIVRVRSTRPRPRHSGHLSRII